MVIYHNIDILMKRVIKSPKLSGGCGIHTDDSVVVELHTVFKQDASLHSVAKETKSFGDIISACANSGDIHNPQKLAESERRSDSIRIGTDVEYYQGLSHLAETFTKIVH